MMPRLERVSRLRRIICTTRTRISAEPLTLWLPTASPFHRGLRCARGGEEWRFRGLGHGAFGTASTTLSAGGLLSLGIGLFWIHIAPPRCDNRRPCIPTPLPRRPRSRAFTVSTSSISSPISSTICTPTSSGSANLGFRPSSKRPPRFSTDSSPPSPATTAARKPPGVASSARRPPAPAERRPSAPGALAQLSPRDCRRAWHSAGSRKPLRLPAHSSTSRVRRAPLRLRAPC